MTDLILRKDNKVPDKPYHLQLRFHDCIGPTEYQHLCFCDADTAQAIVDAGKAYWFCGESPSKSP
jgi:hypothetical protein